MSGLKLMIDLGNKVVEVSMNRSAVANPSVSVGARNLLQKRKRRGIEPAPGNQVVGEHLPCRGVHDGGAPPESVVWAGGVEQRRKIAVAVGVGGNEGAQTADYAADAVPLIAAEEEGAVAYDRSSQRSAELCPLQRIPVHLEKIAGVKNLVAQKTEGVPVKRVGA